MENKSSLQLSIMEDPTNASYGYYYYYYDLYLPSEYVAVLYIMDEVLPVILTIIAIFGNILVIATFMREKNRTFSTAAYFISLATSDLTVAVMGYFITWLSLRVHWSMEMHCKIFAFFYNGSRYVSSMTLAFITLERAMSVCIPHRVKLVCSPVRVKVLLSAIWTVCFSYCTFISVSVGAIVVDGIAFCEVKSQELLHFFVFVHPWIEWSLNFIIPFCFISIGSIVIITKLYSRSKDGLTSTKSHLNRITIVTLCINLTFLLTKLPFAVWSFRLMVSEIIGENPEESLMTQHFWLSFVIFLGDLSHVLNFFIYFISGSQFRKNVKELMRQVFRC